MIPNHRRLIGWLCHVIGKESREALDWLVVDFHLSVVIESVIWLADYVSHDRSSRRVTWLVSCIDRCDLIGCYVLRGRAPPEMEEQEKEVLDWEAELAKQNIPYIDMDEANMVRANQSSRANHNVHYTVVRCK